VNQAKLAAAQAAAGAVPALAACTDNSTAAPAAGGSRTIQVTSTDDSCDLSVDRARAGTLVYEVTNKGSEVTEFYLYDEDGHRIVAEVENVGPGLSRELVVSVPAGSYTSACKPGMVGNGIRGEFTVTASEDPTGGAAGATEQQVATANARYQAFVHRETRALLAGTRRFAAAYRAGDDARARALYAPTRMHWERIETVAESFGDLDPRMDLREADLEQGQRWTGWHRIEKDLWPPTSGGQRPLSRQQRASYADLLVADTETLHRRSADLTFTVDQIANGAKGLLDEVATSKVTGEEEAWSHTDLYDFQANVDGAEVAFQGLQPVLATKDPELGELIERRFVALTRLLDSHRSGTGFVRYTELSRAQVRELSDAVNALSEPLSRLTAAVAL
jgi:iron uptake system component EfeO